MEKFEVRAWMTEDEEMHYSSQVNDNFIMVNQNGMQLFTDEKEPQEVAAIFMRHSGKKDKEGNKIYEGDVVETHERPFEEVANINVVTFENSSFRVKAEDERVNEVALACYADRNIKVLGNIYEHEVYKHLR